MSLAERHLHNVPPYQPQEAWYQPPLQQTRLAQPIPIRPSVVDAYSSSLRAELFGEGPTRQAVTSLLRAGRHDTLNKVLAYPEELADIFAANLYLYGRKELRIFKEHARHDLIENFESRFYGPDAFLGPVFDRNRHVQVGAVAMWFSGQNQSSI